MGTKGFYLAVSVLHPAAIQMKGSFPEICVAYARQINLLKQKKGGKL